MPKLAEIIGCSTKTIATIFSWIGVQEATSEEAKQSIGQIIEYGSDRYFVKINAVVQGEAVEKTITVDGPTLRNKKLFYEPRDILSIYQSEKPSASLFASTSSVSFLLSFSFKCMLNLNFRLILLS